MKVGIVTSIPWVSKRKSFVQVYREAVEQVRYAEELGFDSAWFTEHHFGTHGVNGAVLPFVAYIAGATRRIRLGTAVVVAPLYNPVRLAEDVAEIDILSEGRLELGIGSGYRLDEFKGVGVSSEEGRERTREILELLVKAWTGEPFSYRGKYYTMPDGISVRPTPMSKPHPPIWLSALSQTSLEWIAKTPFNLMTASGGAKFSAICRLRENYNQALIKAGRHPEDSEFYIHIPTHVTSESFEQITNTLAAPVRLFFEAAASGGTIYEGPARPPDQRAAFEDFFEHNAVIGSPEYCLDKFYDLWKQLRFTHLTCHFNVDLPHPMVMKQLEMFARYVLPDLKDIDGQNLPTP